MPPWQTHPAKKNGTDLRYFKGVTGSRPPNL